MKKLIVIIIVIAGIYYFMSGSENEPNSQDQSILIDDSALKALEDAKRLADDAANRANNLNKKSLDELVSGLEKPKLNEQGEYEYGDVHKALSEREKTQTQKNWTPNPLPKQKLLDIYTSDEETKPEDE